MTCWIFGSGCRHLPESALGTASMVTHASYCQPAEPFVTAIHFTQKQKYHSARRVHTTNSPRLRFAWSAGRGLEPLASCSIGAGLRGA